MNSNTTIYNRFFSHVKELHTKMLTEFTQIDYDREIALVAFDDDSGEERMLGVVSIMGNPDGSAA
jgi:acetyltransferase